MSHNAVAESITRWGYLNSSQDTLTTPVRRRPTLASLAIFPNVDSVVKELQPEEAVFCLNPAELRRSASRFRAFPGRVLYAVKCNPHPLVLETLYTEGICDFDVASLEEIKLIQRMFGAAAGQYFNNPAKTRASIKIGSTEHGIRFYTVDCKEEVDKILDEASSDSDLIIAVRLATPPGDARYALSSKFGADPDQAALILRYVAQQGIKAGISFHVGSQCMSPSAFETALSMTGKVLKKAGVPVQVLNVGGGFPAPYPGEATRGIEHYFSRVITGRRDLNLSPNCLLLCEPGRSLVATCGTLIVKVVMRRGNAIFLNDGAFGTLQELGHPREQRPTRLISCSGVPSLQKTKFKVFGPTCDSNDVLGAPFTLPVDVKEGDWIEIGMMGAYSLSMRTQFNGFYTDKIVSIEN
jgi:ornithine decarboxylase